MSSQPLMVALVFVFLSMFVESKELFHGKEYIDDETLAEIRGGFVTANGLLVNFSVNVKSYYQGQLIREVEHDLLGPNIKVIRKYENSVSKIPNVIPIKNDSLEGIVINNGDNYTAALHSVSANQIVNMLVQTDSGKTLEQKMDINIEVANFELFKQTQDGLKLLDRITQN